MINNNINKINKKKKKKEREKNQERGKNVCWVYFLPIVHVD